MKFYGYYQIQLLNEKQAEEVAKWLNKDRVGSWLDISGSFVENTFKVNWLDCFNNLLVKAKEYNINIGVHFYQEYNEDTAGDWHADLGYYEDGRAYCIVREAYVEDVKWSCGKDILEDIEQIEYDN